MRVNAQRTAFVVTLTLNDHEAAWLGTLAAQVGGEGDAARFYRDLHMALLETLGRDGQHIPHGDSLFRSPHALYTKSPTSETETS